jgi:hypothetical protein
LIVADRSDQNHISKQIIECIQKHWKVRWRNFDTSPDMLMGDGLLIIHLTSLRQNINFNNTLCRYHRTYRCQRIGMWCLQTDYTLDMKLLKHYQSIIGVLIWTVSTLRFDVAYYISVLAQYMTRPTEKLVKSGYPELRNRIYAACDATFADDRLTRKSQQGHLLFYNSGPIIWKSNRQRTIALSTTKAELDSFVSCVRSVLHTMRILENMESPQHWC